MNELIEAGMELYAACKVRQDVAETVGQHDSARYYETICEKWEAALIASHREQQGGAKWMPFPSYPLDLVEGK